MEDPPSNGGRGRLTLSLIAVLLNLKILIFLFLIILSFIILENVIFDKLLWNFNNTSTHIIIRIHVLTFLK